MDPVVIEISANRSRQNVDILEFYFNVEEKGEQTYDAIETHYSKRAHLKRIDDVIKDIGNIIGKMNSSSNIRMNENGLDDDLRNSAFIFTNLLLPEELLRYLEKTERPILISTKEQLIPWELIYFAVKGEFLGVKNAAGRQLRTERFVQYTNLEPSEKLSFLIIANPTSDLNATEEEAIKIKHEIQNNFLNTSFEFLMGTECSWLETKKYISSGEFDFIHYAGHVECIKDERGNEQSVLKLANNEIFTLEDAHVLEGMVSKKRHPIIFLNGCKPNATSENIAKGFLEGGARAVVSGLYDILDNSAKEFAVSFYKYLLDGESIGDAVKKTKEFSRKNHPGDATWASYVLYGNPCRYLIKKYDSELYTSEGLINSKKFSPITWQSLKWCLQAAKDTNCATLTTLHLMIALARIKDGCTRAILSENKIGDPVSFGLVLETSIPRKPTLLTVNPKLEKTSLSKNLQNVLSSAYQAALQKKKDVIEECHLIHAILRDENGIIAEVFRTLGISIQQLKKSCHVHTYEGTAIIQNSSDEGHCINSFFQDILSDLTHVIRREINKA